MSWHLQVVTWRKLWSHFFWSHHVYFFHVSLTIYKCKSYSSVQVYVLNFMYFLSVTYFLQVAAMDLYTIDLNYFNRC